jgi:hypothetical protein
MAMVAGMGLPSDVTRQGVSAMEHRLGLPSDRLGDVGVELGLGDAGDALPAGGLVPSDS